MRLEISSCIIRSFDAADAVALQRYADNRNIWINLRDIFPHPYTLEDAAAFLNRVAQEKPERCRIHSRMRGRGKFRKSG